MAKFHINPESGNAGICSATQGGCPFGGEENHFSTVIEARTAYEAIQEPGSFTPLTKGTTKFEADAEQFALEFPEKAEAIDNMSLQQMLGEWRYAPIGAFQKGDGRSEYFEKVMLAKREANPGGWVAASKALSN